MIIDIIQKKMHCGLFCNASFFVFFIFYSSDYAEETEAFLLIIVPQISRIFTDLTCAV